MSDKMVIATAAKDFSSTLFGNISVGDKITMGVERYKQMAKTGHVEKSCKKISEPNKPGPKPKAK